VALKKFEETVFKRELDNILDRVRSYGTLFDERLEKVDAKVEKIQQIVERQSTSSAFGEQRVLVSELLSLLKEAEPTFRSIRDSVLQMKHELQRGGRVNDEEGNEPEEGEEET
jgi:hypothetical protein